VLVELEIDADIVHIMDAGCAMEIGTPEELSRRGGWRN
jgi:ABC-type multidrug transport system fused ATPase/permease subunit